MKIPAAPVMEADADLQDPVIQAANRRVRVAPQQLQRLVLLEELAFVELLDAPQKLLWGRLRAAGTSGLVRCVGRLSLRRPG